MFTAAVELTEKRTTLIICVLDGQCALKIYRITDVRRTDDNLDYNPLFVWHSQMCTTNPVLS
jgi:hypothetical protein